MIAKVSTASINTPSVGGAQTSGNGSKTLVILALVGVALFLGYRFVYLPYMKKQEEEKKNV